ncbi:alpha/beta hydrolase [Photobacterium sagamiensis]|uniref:alpha/beta hydrolase n=1 Tax=Photobacterium sagamiensis TaxID=2910241 RepID=UPI003D0AD307
MTSKNYDPTRLLLLPNFSIPQLNRTRQIRIYLPIDYQTTQHHYPVMYMHDGQNLFEPALSYSGKSWQAAETLDDLQREGLTTGVILVGIDNSPLHDGLRRMNEYSPWLNNQAPKLAHWENNKQHMGGEGDAYADFIASTLKPYIDNHFRTQPEREKTTVAGSSMGGFISLYIALKHQSVFGNAGVFSPAFWFAENSMQHFIQATKISAPINIYMDIGTAETSDQDIAEFPALYLDGAKRIHQQLGQHDERIHCQLYVDPGAIHNEQAWAKRFPQMVRQFYYHDKAAITDA